LNKSRQQAEVVGSVLILSKQVLFDVRAMLLNPPKHVFSTPIGKVPLSAAYCQLPRAHLAVSKTSLYLLVLKTKAFYNCKNF
jgi:hypothetical protein